MKRGLGVHVNVFQFMGESALAYVWVPKDELDAQYRMLVGLKLSFPTDLEEAMGVQSHFRWR